VGSGRRKKKVAFSGRKDAYFRDLFPEGGNVIMSQAQPNPPEPVRKRRNLTDEEKYEVFLEASRGDVRVGEVLRKWNLHSTDLQRIRETVRNGALREFQARRSRKPMVSAAEVEQLRAEKGRLEQTLIEQSVELMLLKKKINGS